jgi:hypothetical protein
MKLKTKDMNNETEWVDIPGYGGKYQMSKDGEIRAYYKYKGHNIAPHYKILKGDGQSIVLYGGTAETKLCRDYLYEMCFGIQHVDSLEGEKWLPIRGYEGYYKISNKGRILAERRFLVRKDGVRQFCKEQIVQARSKINSGYYAVNLIKEKNHKHFLVHRIVAEHFLENPGNLEQVNHKDENKLNNCVENLEWCSKSYNANYGTNQERRCRTRRTNNNGKYGYKRKVNR